MKKAIILNSVEDAVHCIENGLASGCILFSTHSGIDVYLKENYGLNCRCLSSFLSDDKTILNKSYVAEFIDNLLDDLDKNVSIEINRQIKTEMKWFAPLYSYIGKQHYLGYISFAAAVRNAIDSNRLESIAAYNRKLDFYLDTGSDIYTLLHTKFDNMQIEFIKLDVHEKDSINKTLWRKIIQNNPLYSIAKGKEYLFDFLRQYGFSGKRRTVFTDELSYNLKFLKQYLNRSFNVVYYKNDFFIKPSCYSKKHYTNITIPDLSVYLSKRKYDDILEAIVAKDIGDDFIKNIQGYTKKIEILQDINRNYPISVGLWSFPPIKKTKALMFQYLKSEKISIIGAQHGNLYGECYEPWHFDTDFNRCDYFMTYGFERNDLERIYPDRNIEGKYLPFGFVNNKKLQCNKKKVDIFFPITNSFSVFENGMNRTAPHEMTSRQIDLLVYLDSLKDVSVYVKPYIFSDYTNCSVLPLLQRMNNIKVLYGMKMADFLMKWSPRSILIEYPSQPLAETIGLDTEIFLMNDRILPYDKKVLDLLKKRVHFCESTTAVKEKINLFVHNKLERKRDNEYFTRYVNKLDTERNITEFIYNTVNDQ